MNITVLNLKGNVYKVTGEGIDAEVRYYSSNSSVTGKGARKFKEEIIEAVRAFVNTQWDEECRIAIAEVEKEQQSFRESEVYKEIDLLGLYQATLKDFDNGWSNHTTLLTGYEVKADSTVIAAEKVVINNTDLFRIGGSRWTSGCLSRKSLVDDRIVPVGLDFYATGLALKELLLEGFEGHGDIRKIEEEDRRYESIKSYVYKEMERALTSSEDVQPKKEFTKDQEEIRYNWFSSKPRGWKDLEEMRVASYYRYVIKESVTLDSDTFEQFKTNFDMNLLNVSFVGGSSSTVELGLDEETSFYELSEPDKAKYIQGTYSNVLEVKCEDPSYDYSLLLDMQGYDYPREAGIRYFEEGDKALTEEKSNVLDFTQVFNKRKEEQELNSLRAEFINEILTTLNFEQKVLLASCAAEDEEKFKEALTDCYLKYKLKKLIKA